jgi:hypothetical protein
MLGVRQLALLLGLFAGQRADPAPGGAIEVAAPSGRCVARIAKLPGQERLADALARWQLSVHDLAQGRELWSMHYPHDPAPARYFISDDGSTFVRLSEAFSEARPVVRIDRFGELVAEHAGAELGLGRDDVVRDARGARWLVEAGDRLTWGWGETGAGPALLLALESERGWRREVDASLGVILALGEHGGLGEPQVIPGFPADTQPAPVLQVPYVTEALIPRVSLGALPLRIGVAGQHATPNWKLYAFALRRESQDHLVLVPYSQPPPRDSLQAHVIEGFQGEALVQGLAPGRYRITLAGSEAAAEHPTGEVEVLPGRLHVRLEIHGGLLGVSDVVELFKPGIARAARSRSPEDAPPRHLTPEELHQLQQLLDALPAEPRSSRTPGAADMFEYRLGWWAGDGWRAVVLDDGTAQGPAGGLIELLGRL